MPSVRDALRGEIKNIEDWCWSDSTITLSWIKAENLKFKPFVENRLRSIRKNITPVRWNHCRSAQNPSDIITRFNSCNLNSNDLWWHGPEFLKEIIEPGLFQKEGSRRNPNLSTKFSHAKNDSSGKDEQVRHSTIMRAYNKNDEFSEHKTGNHRKFKNANASEINSSSNNSGDRMISWFDRDIKECIYTKDKKQRADIISCITLSTLQLAHLYTTRYKAKK